MERHWKECGKNNTLLSGWGNKSKQITKKCNTKGETETTVKKKLTGLKLENCALNVSTLSTTCQTYRVQRCIKLYSVKHLGLSEIQRFSKVYAENEELIFFYTNSGGTGWC